MNKIKHITRLLMCGVVSILLALSFNVKGVNELNSGQSNLTNKVFTELEFPNIIVEKETDWKDKLGVTIGTNMYWSDICDIISSKYKSANIFVVGNALSFLEDMGSNLLPTSVKLPIYWAIGNNYILNIKMMDYSPDKRNAHIDLTGARIESMYTLASSLTTFSLYLSNKYDGINLWRVSSPIYVYVRSGGSYVDLNTTLSPETATVANYNYELDIAINNLPLLNPVTQGFIGMVKANTSKSFDNRDSGYIQTSFQYFVSGKDNNTGDEYRIIYNGFIALQVVTDSNNQIIFKVSPTLPSGRQSKLWIQIYKKAPTDLTYTMTHREEDIGTENCYISAIRLLP